MKNRTRAAGSRASRPDLQKLVDLVARLRAPDGCPWDREQGLADVRAYLLEEAHELAAAIDAANWEELAEELGDVLFQIAFIGRLAEEAGAFRLADAVERVHRKMVARHPHVFGDEELADAAAVRQAWERRKLTEKPDRESLLEGVPASLPSLLAAYRLTQKASGVGFDWPDAAAVLAKVDEEVAELKEALGAAAKPAGDTSRQTLEARDGRGGGHGIAEELGDLLFTLANLARKLDLDPEAALAGTNRKFRRRFAAVEAGLAARGKSPAEATLAEMDELWEAAKAEPQN